MSQGLALFESERRDKICICGFADSKKHAPFGDDSWWVWGMNDLYAHVPRVDVTFEIHHLLNMANRRNPQHEAVMAAGGKRGAAFEPGKPPTPIFLQESRPEWPTTITFPKERIFEAFGDSPGGTYFTNSVGWMIALAILELTEVKKVNGMDLRVSKPGAELSICGISMAADSEYVAQRPNVEYWVGRAIGYGIKTFVPDDAHILKAATTYGYSSSEPLMIRLQADRTQLSEQTLQLQQQAAQLQQQMAMIEAQLNQVRGMKGYIDTLQRNLTIDTEIKAGSTQKGPGVGRDSILTLQDGQVVESLVVPQSDGQINQPVA